MSLVEQPDEVVQGRPHRCTNCQHPLEGVAGKAIERRQVQDLPPWRLAVSEHQVEQVQCPACQQMNRGFLPAELSATAQYGVLVRALAVYLHQAQLVSAQRTCEGSQRCSGANSQPGH